MTGRLLLVVHLYIRAGKEAAFEEFERSAERILLRHGGRLEYRIRCTAGAGPSEIHVVSFPDEGAFAEYRADPEYIALNEARADSISMTTTVTGVSASSFLNDEDPLHIIGVDHVYLSVTDMSRSEAFYDSVMAALGFRKGDKPIAGERHAHYFNPSLQITIRPARSPEPADAYRAGLHHLCLQADGETAVEEAYKRLTALGVSATPPKKYPEYNPDYHATFFQDPDGIRLEIVARTPHRDRIARRWKDFRVFLNPLGVRRAKPDGTPS